MALTSPPSATCTHRSFPGPEQAPILVLAFVAEVAACRDHTTVISKVFVQPSTQEEWAAPLAAVCLASLAFILHHFAGSLSYSLIPSAFVAVCPFLPSVSLPSLLAVVTDPTSPTPITAFVLFPFCKFVFKRMVYIHECLLLFINYTVCTFACLKSHLQVVVEPWYLLWDYYKWNDEGISASPGKVGQGPFALSREGLGTGNCAGATRKLVRWRRPI